MSVNSIGSYAFVSLRSPNGGDGLEVPFQHGDVQQRPGVDGTALIQTGVKGDPFLMESLVDVDTFYHAQGLKVLYRGLCNQNPQIVIVSGTNYYTELGIQYLVRDVQSIAKRVSCCAGGLLGGTARAVVQARWVLIPIFVGSVSIPTYVSNFADA